MRGHMNSVRYQETNKREHLTWIRSKRTTVTFLALFLLAVGQAPLVAGQALASELPSVTHYALKVQLSPKEESMRAQARMTIANSTDKPQLEIPFLLYRLLEVESVVDETGAPLEFSQTIVRMADEPKLQLNLVKVRLPRPLPQGASTKVTLKYKGFIYGYREVWPYVRETIGEEYTLLRPDSLAYPLPALPSLPSFFELLHKPFTYDLQVTVPAGYSVAMGGWLKETGKEDGSLTFVYQSKVPVWRLDIAAAKFIIRKDDEEKLFVHVLPGHEAGAERVLKGMKGMIALYSRLFGEIRNFQGYTAIEIPAGWGSQAGDFYFLQVAEAFEDPKRLHEVYHEVAHNWNAKAKPEVQRCRYFDEAFASYFEALAMREFEGQKAFEERMDSYRKSFARSAQKERRNYETPIADFGKYELGGLSYSKGAWSLYVLHELMGGEEFQRIIRRLLADFAEKGVDFKDFQRTAETVSKRDLKKFFDEWIYGTESSRLLLENASLKDMILRYQ